MGVVTFCYSSAYIKVRVDRSLLVQEREAIKKYLSKLSMIGQTIETDIIFFKLFMKVW